MQLLTRHVSVDKKASYMHITLHTVPITYNYILIFGDSQLIFYPHMLECTK